MYFMISDENGHIATWPDGGAYIDQPSALVACFKAIEREANAIRREAMQAKSARR